MMMMMMIKKTKMKMKMKVAPLFDENTHKSETTMAWWFSSRTDSSVRQLAPDFMTKPVYRQSWTNRRIGFMGLTDSFWLIAPK